MCYALWAIKLCLWPPSGGAMSLAEVGNMAALQPFILGGSGCMLPREILVFWGAFRTLVQWDKNEQYITLWQQQLRPIWKCIGGKLYLKNGKNLCQESEFDDDRSGSIVDGAFTMFIESIELVELVSWSESWAFGLEAGIEAEAHRESRMSEASLLVSTSYMSAQGVSQ